MVDSQEAISVQPDQIWEKYAGQIRDYAFFLTNVKTTPAEDFINRDLYQSLQRENLHELHFVAVLYSKPFQINIVNI